MVGQLPGASGVVRMHMTGREISGVLVLVALAGSAAMPPAHAVPAGAMENPYGVITNRNAFGLRPPPDPEVAPPPAPPAPPPNVFLTGVSHQRGVKRAFFVINRPGAKTPEYESAVEGDEIQDLKIQEINAKEGKVRVLISGRELVLNFADNGMKSVATPGAAPVPGRPGGGVPQPVAPVPQPTSGGGPVVIGRGGVNLNDSGGNAGTAVPAPVYAGAVGDGGGGVPVQVPVNTTPNQPTARTLPARALTRGSVVADQFQAPGGVSESGGSTGGSISVPVPPPSRFQ